MFCRGERSTKGVRMPLAVTNYDFSVFLLMTTKPGLG